MDRRTLFVAATLLATAGCANDRDDAGLTTAGTSATASAGDDGGDGPGGDDGWGETGGTGGGDDTATGEDSGADDHGSDGGSDDGGDDGDPGETGAPPADDPPDCEPLWEYYGMGYIRQDAPMNAEEMWCYVIGQRISYSVHTREAECYDEPNTLEGPPPVSWPFEMEWDPSLMVAAQAEAERVAAGGSPKGGSTSNGFDHPIHVDGCASSEYTITSVNDRVEYWTPGQYDAYAGLAKSNGRARLSVYYYDPGPDAPRLTRLGVGFVDQGGDRTWALIFR